jgi:hypothetical protein
VLQVAGLQHCDGRRSSAHRLEEGRNIVGFLQTSAAEIVAPAKRYDATLSEEAVKLEGFEIQLLQTTDQATLLCP